MAIKQAVYWKKCARRAIKGTAAFANDWQWVFGSPAAAFGFGAYLNAIQADSGKGQPVVTSGSPIADAFLAALAAFVVTWLVAFLINLVRAPGQIHTEDAERIAVLEAARSSNEKRIAIKNYVGLCLEQTKPFFQDIQPDGQEATKWIQRTKKFIGDAFGDGEAALFMSDFGYTFHSSGSVRDTIRNSVGGRSRRLTELISRIETMPIRDGFDPSNWSAQ